MTDLYKLFGINPSTGDVSTDGFLSSKEKVEEVETLLSADNSEDRPMILRFVLRSAFNEVGLNVEDHIGVSLPSLDGDSPYGAAFKSEKGLRRAINAMMARHNLTID